MAWRQVGQDKGERKKTRRPGRGNDAECHLPSKATCSCLEWILCVTS